MKGNLFLATIMTLWSSFNFDKVFPRTEVKSQPKYKVKHAPRKPLKGYKHTISNKK